LRLTEGAGEGNNHSARNPIGHTCADFTEPTGRLNDERHLSNRFSDGMRRVMWMCLSPDLPLPLPPPSNEIK